MIRRRSEVDLLDSTISALEHLVLGGPDDEILSQSPTGIRAADDVRALIEGHLANHDALSWSDRTAAERSPDRIRRTSRTSKDRADRLAFLQRLVAARPELSPQLGAVFASGKAPTNEELDNLTEELIRLGLLPKDGTEKK